MTEWLLLTATLPTRPSALRVRVWRALKATGAGTLREGVYLLPASAPSAPTLRDLERTITASGAVAHLLVVQSCDDVQDKAFRSLFDRSDLHAELLQSVKEARGALGKIGDAALRKRLRDVEQRFAGIQSIDFFPGKASGKATDALAAFRLRVEALLSPGEPEMTTREISVESVDGYQGRTWATRKRPWVDRLATAWLIGRFIDKSPRFIWLADTKKCPRGALGFDYDGARFTHVGDSVTFEMVAQTFGLTKDAAIRRVGQLVHCIDIGGPPVDEAAGLEMMVRGLQARHHNDDQLLAAACTVFDTVYAAMQSES